MNRYELVREIAARTGMYIKDADIFEEAFEQIITEKLLEDEEVSLHGFGTFRRKDYDARNMYCPYDREYYEKEARKRAKFAPGKTLQRKLNEQFLEEIPTEEI